MKRDLQWNASLNIILIKDKFKNFKNTLDFFWTINYNIERRLTESTWRVVRAGRRSTIGNRVSR